MLKLESTAWGRHSFTCPPEIIKQFKDVCFHKTGGHMYHALIAFMYAVIQEDLDLAVCDEALAHPEKLLTEVADDEDNLDAFKVRIMKGGITVNPTNYVEEFFYLK